MFHFCAVNKARMPLARAPVKCSGHISENNSLSSGILELAAQLTAMNAPLARRLIDVWPWPNFFASAVSARISSPTSRIAAGVWRNERGTRNTGSSAASWSNPARVVRYWLRYRVTGGLDFWFDQCGKTRCLYWRNRLMALTWIIVIVRNYCQISRRSHYKTIRSTPEPHR